MHSESTDKRELAQCLVDSQRSLYAYILKLTHNSADAKDVLQETNVVVLSKQDEFPAVENFSAWVARIAYFQVLAYRTRLGRERVAFSDELVRTIAARNEATIDPEDPQLRGLSHCLNKLPKKDRQILDLRYTDDLAPREIAQTLGRTPRAISQALYRIRLAMADCIERELSTEEKA